MIKNHNALLQKVGYYYTSITIIESMIPQSHIQQTMDSCTEAKLKITKFIETYDKSSPTQLSAQFFFDQLE